MRIFTTLLLTTAILYADNVQAQYCMLPGRKSYSQFQPGIKNFKLNTINRTSSNVENPLTQPSLVVTTDTTALQRGQTYTVTIVHTRDSTQAAFVNARNNIRVWIDYNNNKAFTDAGETVVSADLQTYGTFTATFTVPATAPIGIVRLRATAKMSADAGHELPTPCDDPADPFDYHGEMEDYTVRILPATGIGNTQPVLTASVYPNPTKGIMTVSLGAKTSDAVTIDLYDITGKKIANMVNEASQTATSYNVNLDDYVQTQGVYFIRVSSGSAYAYTKVIKAD